MMSLSGSSRMLTNILFVCVLAVFCLCLNSCGHKPIPSGTDEATAVIIPGISSPLLQMADNPTENELNNVALLDVGEEALLLRIHLIRAARHSIAMQTLIWDNDETGRLLMYEMIQAAKRGVKVQLLIDHYVSEKHPEIAAFLATVHPNLEIKLYNPVIGQFSGHKINPSILDKVTSLVSDFNKVNQRMHNKVFIVDNKIGITGGRNNQNPYYDQARGMNFKDRDVLIVGPVVADMQQSFKDFWEFKLSIPLSEMVDEESVRDGGEPKVWSTREDFVFNGLFTELFVDADDQQKIEQLFVSQLHPVKQIAFIADTPGKNDSKFLGRFYGAGEITQELAQLVSGARESVYIDTPYLVLSHSAIELFFSLRESQPDIDIRIVTNSLASTDSWQCYALSFQQKQLMLSDLKFTIYEFKPLPGDIHTFIPGYDALKARQLTPSEQEDLGELSSSTKYPDLLQRPPEPGEPYLALHAKSLVIDGEIAFIGSYNLDPRSENLNTEVGLVVRDSHFAKIVQESIVLGMAPENSWVIAKNKYPVGLETPNAMLGELSRLLPFVDPWPLRYAGSYELRENSLPLDPGDDQFYEHYDFVGNFPDVPPDRAGKVLGTLTTKTFFGVVKPLL